MDTKAIVYKLSSDVNPLGKNQPVLIFPKIWHNRAESKEADMWLKIKDFWSRYESKVVLTLGLVLFSGLVFQAGILKGQKAGEAPLVIEKTDFCPATKAVADLSHDLNPDLNHDKQKEDPSKKCLFLASRNSNKYHLPSCRWAKNIKEENRVCFSSGEEAQSKGYQPDANCIK